MQLCTCRKHVECREPGRMKGFMQSVYNAFVRVYIYIYGNRFMVLYLINCFPVGPEKHARPYIYRYIHVSFFNDV